MSDAITTKDIVLRTEQKVDQLVADVAELKGKTIARVDQHDLAIADHELRIRSLERFRFAFPSLSLVAAAAAIGETVYLIFH